jgi:hypothetical protein
MIMLSCFRPATGSSVRLFVISIGHPLAAEAKTTLPPLPPALHQLPALHPQLEHQQLVLVPEPTAAI